jgi:PadR family transcriptional regulator, regulatory protein PadR
MANADLLPGTLDMLILKAVSLGELHGYGVLRRIERITNASLEITQGSLYPALSRLESKGCISAEWGERSNKRKAKFYTLTQDGHTRLEEETQSWQRFADAVAVALDARPEV